MHVAVDFRGRIEGRWRAWGMWMAMRVKTKGVRVETDGENRLLDGFESPLVSGGEGEEILEILDRVSFRTDP
jgi:hypothetical protein